MNTDIAAQRALDRLEKSGFDALTDTEKTLATTWLIEAGVNNGGFVDFFTSSRGNVAFNTPAALRAIGANQLAAIAVEANSVFAPVDPPLDHNIRAISRHLPPKSVGDTSTDPPSAMAPLLFDQLNREA